MDIFRRKKSGQDTIDFGWKTDETLLRVSDKHHMPMCNGPTSFLFGLKFEQIYALMKNQDEYSTVSSVNSNEDFFYILVLV